MDDACFDRLTRSLALLLSRRVLVGNLALASLAWPTLAEAKRRRKRKKQKKSKPNAFGCINVGGFCTKSGQCCSGICQGKKGKKKCLAHDQGNCPAGQGCISGNPSQPCLTDAGEVGACQTTTGNAGYCSGGGECFACTRDTDCVPFCGPQAACSACPSCILINGTETTCVGPRADSCQFPP